MKKTLQAAVEIEYANKKVYLLDDKGNSDCRELAAKYGCGYFAREDHKDAKAGNLNYALQRTNGDLLLTLDADQVPQPQIIDRLIGYFNFPRIAFVPSKQEFEVPPGDPFGNRDLIFYNVMQSGKDSDNSAFSCGSGVMYRRKALEEIGGFSTWGLVEDVHTSIRLHDRGWRSIYYNFSLTKGTAPVEIQGVCRQRLQWATDSLRILFWDCPLGRKGLNLKQRLQYFHLGFVYLVAAFIMPLFFITPIWSLLTREFVLDAPISEYVLYRFPYFMAMSLAYGVINYPTPYGKPFQMWTGLFPVFIKATWLALRSRKTKPRYHVNSKQVVKVRVKNTWLAILPQMGIMFLSLFSIPYAFLVGNTPWDFYLLNSFWALWSIWTLSGIVFAAVRKHEFVQKGSMRWTPAPSFLLRIKELIGTISLSFLMILFFTQTDLSKVKESLNHSRAGVLRFLHHIEATPGLRSVKNISAPALHAHGNFEKQEEPLSRIYGAVPEALADSEHGETPAEFLPTSARAEGLEKS